MRLAGTARQYSSSAMDQLTRITAHSGCALNFKCPYHAKVMNTLDSSSRTGGSTVDSFTG